jgi:hypothetical protein
MCTKLTHVELVVFVSELACVNSRTAGRILMKFYTNVGGYSNLVYLIPYDH